MSRCGSPSVERRLSTFTKRAVQEVAGRRRDHGERIAGGEFRRAVGGFVRRQIVRQRVEPLLLRGARCRTRICRTACGNRLRRNGASGSFSCAQPVCFQRLPVHARERLVFPAERGLTRRSRRFRTAPVRRVPSRARGREKSPCSAARLADRCDRRQVDHHVRVTVRLVDVEMLELRRRRQEQIGVVGGVGLEMLEHDGEQIFARETRGDSLRIRRDRHRIRVVDDRSLRLSGRTWRRPGCSNASPIAFILMTRLPSTATRASGPGARSACESTGAQSARRQQQRRPPARATHPSATAGKRSRARHCRRRARVAGRSSGGSQPFSCGRKVAQDRR